MTRKLIALLVPCVALAACVQVLGLEEAELDDSTGSTPQQTTFARSRVSCEQMPEDNCACEDEPSQDCTDCLNRCGTAVEGCTADNGCRKDIDDYAFCLGRLCGGDQAECARELGDAAFRDCVVVSCGDVCDRTKLVTRCELYCACMASYCEGELVMAGVDDCMATCQELDPDLVDCRRQHCDLGRGVGDHCRHASGRLDVCEAATARPVETRAFCLDGREQGGYCDLNSDCCSDSCLSGGLCE